MRLADWFLTAAERGNPSTGLDARRHDGLAWSTGNDVRPLIHGASYFAALLARVPAMVAGDVLLFTDWRGVRAVQADRRSPRRVARRGTARAKAARATAPL